MKNDLFTASPLENARDALRGLVAVVALWFVVCLVLALEVPK